MHIYYKGFKQSPVHGRTRAHYIQTLTHIHTHARVRARARTHARTHTHTHTHKHTHTRARLSSGAVVRTSESQLIEPEFESCVASSNHGQFHSLYVGYLIICLVQISHFQNTRFSCTYACLQKERTRCFVRGIHWTAYNNLYLNWAIHCFTASTKRS